jgi:5-methylcytosine-specific restriction endonuclease McrA
MGASNPPVCAAPIKQGPNKGTPTATGTTAGYYRHRTAKEPPCEPCRLAHCDEVREWATERKDEVYARALARREANPTPNRERAKAWAKANPDRMAARATAWRRANPERRAEIVRQWRERHPEQAKAIAARRRAMMRQASTVNFTADQLDQRMSMFGHSCWMCGGPFEHVDHVKPIARGGSHCLANLRPACAPCNKAKAAKWPFDIRRRRTPIAS